MTQYTGVFPEERRTSKKVILSVIIFLLIAVAGLTYVKWYPYYNKTLDVIVKHTIGSSIVSGKNPVAPEPSWASAWEYAKAYYTSVWKAAVLGILLGSLVQVLIPTGWLLRVLGKANFRSTAIGGLASIPGMMCTCCAAPLAVGLRKKHVSVGAALAFWLGNPTINPATLIFMTFVLSWKFTLLRLVFGLLLTFGVSYLANRFAVGTKLPKEMTASQEEAIKSEQTGSFLSRWGRSIWSMILHLVPAYIIAVLLLGAARAWMFPQLGEAASNSIIAIIGFAIVGMLFVIPTAGEIPIVQSMMSFGLGVGPASALLITLPSVSLPSLLMISKSFPKKVIWFVAASVVLIGILAGIAGMLLL